ncbi:armadillo repeat-containing protein 3-like [Erpetoichthys calabaricus]|uniref:armadillo repeat-containing protein 3-like n=1 Tax=Erpetoichthys calabaricus TaxID=27687 RepID=UPI0022347E6D|nr:armadillo repeat-containing protein 3-like [Erpetoichthys calabaricus]
MKMRSQIYSRCLDETELNGGGSSLLTFHFCLDTNASQPAQGAKRRCPRGGPGVVNETQPPSLSTITLAEEAVQVVLPPPHFWVRSSSGQQVATGAWLGYGGALLGGPLKTPAFSSSSLWMPHTYVALEETPNDGTMDTRHRGPAAPFTPPMARPQFLAHIGIQSQDSPKWMVHRDPQFRVMPVTRATINFPAGWCASTGPLGMAKKGKKEAESYGKDSFDPLLIESKNAATVVLMLQSPELDVILKACEAIYRYAEKGDENKAILAELGALEPISRLIKHEDKPVRRSAVMVLGVISAQNDVKKYLKKMNVIPSVIELLEPEEDVVIHEFASLCLSFLSSEPSVKVQIINEDGLEPLIGLLSSADPDVKKNSLETIYNLVQDFYSRAVICELNGIAPLLELLKSDYPVIQQLTLKTLATITSDAETRMALRELEGLDYLIEMLGANDLSDLHVDALLVISNCLEDEDTMQLIQQTGALDKLMQFARTATLVDVQRKAVNAILRAAQNSKNKKILHDHGVEKILVGLLGPDNADIRETACLAITVMCENESSKVSFGKWGKAKQNGGVLPGKENRLDSPARLCLSDVIKPLVQLLQNDYGEVKEAAALALSSLTTANMNNSIAVYKARGIEPLVQLLANEREGVVAHVAAVLTNMSSQNILRSNIQAKGVMTALVGPLQSASSLVQSKAALAVSAFACDSEAREEFRIAGGLVALVWLLNSNINEVRRNACWAVFVCASDEPTCLEMFRLGALEILQEINLSTCRKNNFSEAALQKLFEGNLSIKYSLYGGLSSSDIIVDGFYDPGRVKPGKKVLPLEDLFKMEVNQQRPIILVNGRTGDDDLVESVSGDEKLVDGSEWTTGRSVSKDKSPSKTKGKGKEDEDEDDDRKTWLPPFDADFYNLVNEVTKLISPLENTRDRVVELAKFVAETMGGGVERRKLHNLYWELHLSELKYELKSNVIPIGKIKKGFFCHRALLFKVTRDNLTYFYHIFCQSNCASSAPKKDKEGIRWWAAILVGL